MTPASDIGHFEAAARTSATQEDLTQLLDEACRRLGFDHFALLHHASIDDPRLHGRRNALIRLDSYPPDWAKEIIARGLAGADPVHHASMRTNVGFVWGELPDLVEVDRQARLLLDLAPRFGIADGFTVPINVPGEPAGSCSFAVGRRRPLPIHNLLAAEQIGAHAFRAARRLAGYPFRARPPRLSRRERQCVRLIAAGKTDWEIAAILGISVQTVHQYIKSARAAYGIVSRAQLAVCGLRDFLVSFEEAIPPSG